MTRRKSPILRIGIRSIVGSRLAAARSDDGQPQRGCSATASASASVALVVTSPRSTPRWTIVWAIWGRMPLMMQSAPISRAAATVFEQVLGDQRVDGGHAGDVDDRDRRAGLDDPLEEALHDHLGAGAVERADERQREDPVPQLHDGVESSSSSCCWLPMTSSRTF